MSITDNSNQYQCYKKVENKYVEIQGPIEVPIFSFIRRRNRDGSVNVYAREERSFDNENQTIESNMEERYPQEIEDAIRNKATVAASDASIEGNVLATH